MLAHETVHVLARHSAQQIASNDLTNGLIGAVGVASGDANTARTAAVIGQLISMRYSREDETQSDTLGVCLMIAAGYNPEAMIEVMHVLEASGGADRQDFSRPILTPPTVSLRSKRLSRMPPPTVLRIRAKWF